MTSQALLQAHLDVMWLLDNGSLKSIGRLHPLLSGLIHHTKAAPVLGVTRLQLDGCLHQLQGLLVLLTAREIDNGRHNKHMAAKQ